MWKIDNSPIYDAYKMTSEFVNDVLTWACDNRNIDESRIMESIVNTKLYNVSQDCSKLRDIMLKLSNCIQIKCIYEHYKYYSNNFDAVLNGDKPEIILGKNALEVASEAFKYFYDELLTTNAFWREYNSGNKITKLELRKKIGSKYSICPYCDAHPISYIEASNIDHFLPISKYPILGIYWENFVICCSTCNLYIKNDENARFPIMHPYKQEIAKYITFKFDNKSIDIIYNTDDKIKKLQLDNYLNLFKIKYVYNTFWKKIECEELSINTRLNRAVKNLSEVTIKNIEQKIDEEIQVHIDILRSQKHITELIKLKVDFGEYYLSQKKSLAQFFYFELKGADKLIKNNQNIRKSS